MLNFKVGIPTVYSSMFLAVHREMLGKWMSKEVEFKEGVGIDYSFDTFTFSFKDCKQDIALFCLESLLQGVLDWNQDVFTRGKISIKKASYGGIDFIVKSTGRWRSKGQQIIKQRIEKGELPVGFIKHELLS